MGIGAFIGGVLFAIANAAISLFWLDELLTFHVSRLGSPVEIWAAPEKMARLTAQPMQLGRLFALGAPAVWSLEVRWEQRLFVPKRLSNLQLG